MDHDDIKLLELLAKLSDNRSPVEKVSDTIVDLVEAPFKIASSLFDDIFGL